MNSPVEQKKLLIESMKKLVTHVSNNPQRQREIFDALSLQDLNKIIINLKDDNQYLRRISALLLCELFYQNPQTKLAAIKLLSIQPSTGRICLSGIPQSIHKYPSTLKKCIELMQMPVIASEQEQDKICWVINLERKVLKMELLQYKKYSSFTFIDPLKNIFGFAIPNAKSNPNDHLQISIERARDTEPRSSVTSPLNQSLQTNSEFYKHYLQSRSRSKDSKRDSFSSNYVNISLDVADSDRRGYVRPITSRQNANSYTSKREEISSSFQAPKANTIQNISQFARNGYNPKFNRTSYDPSHSQKLQHPIRQTDITRHQGDFNRPNLTDRSDLKEGRRVSGNTSPVVSNHQKFYKRVKDILKK